MNSPPAWAHGRPVEDLTVLLTVYQRDTLAEQLTALNRQTISPSQIVVYHDCAFRKIPKRRLVRQGIQVVQNSYNTKYHGRFAYLLTAQTEWIAVLDDDVIPGPRCLENYLQQAKDFQAIVGGMGRIGYTNPERPDLVRPVDQGIREHPTLVDFVGQMWVFRKERLFDMFSMPPPTYATGEDMHLCFASKIRSGVISIAAAQKTMDDSCDLTMGKIAGDRYASFRSTPKNDRADVERYFTKQGVKLISAQEQSDFQSQFSKN